MTDNIAARPDFTNVLQEPDRMIDEPEAPHVHHAKSGVAWLDLALAVAVLALSAASLLTAQHTGHTMEKLVEENSRLVRANATPVLQFLSGNVGDSGRELTLTVANVGTGTARVIWFEVKRNGRARRDAEDLIEYLPKPSERDYVPTRPVGGTYFPADESRRFVGWKYPAGAMSRAKWDAFDRDRQQGRVTASACFCSVLGECWVSSLLADTPRSVTTCEPAGHLNFSG